MKTQIRHANGAEQGRHGLTAERKPAQTGQPVDWQIAPPGE